MYALFRIHAKGWRKIRITRFEILCHDNVAVKKYQAEVQLTLYFADIQNGKIVYNVSATDHFSLEYIRFAEEHPERQINSALSYAIEDIFSSATVKSKIKETLSRGN